MSRNCSRAASRSSTFPALEHRVGEVIGFFEAFVCARKCRAFAQLVTRGKEQLVLIRPYENGLIMHSLYYANEVRNFADIAGRALKGKPGCEFSLPSRAVNSLKAMGGHEGG